MQAKQSPCCARPACSSTFRRLPTCSLCIHPCSEPLGVLLTGRNKLPKSWRREATFRAACTHWACNRQLPGLPWLWRDHGDHTEHVPCLLPTPICLHSIPPCALPPAPAVPVLASADAPNAAAAGARALAACQKGPARTSDACECLLQVRQAPDKPSEGHPQRLPLPLPRPAVPQYKRQAGSRCRQLGWVGGRCAGCCSAARIAAGRRQSARAQALHCCGPGGGGMARGACSLTQGRHFETQAAAMVLRCPGWGWLHREGVSVMGEALGQPADGKHGVQRATDGGGSGNAGPCTIAGLLRRSASALGMARQGPGGLCSSGFVLRWLRQGSRVMLCVLGAAQR